MVNSMEIIGCSAALKEINRLIQQVANTHANVLLIGESGTGKELVAKAIHANSTRAREQFVAVNCAAIPADLLESELFGHEKGAFTGAITARRGRFELAHKGTIFLDEIGEMPLAMQAKLLRVLQDRSFERIGSNVTITTEMRVISATNCDLETAVKAGSFREDLYYRLNVFPIVIPPLRARVDDIALLIDYYLAKNNAKMHTACSLSDAAKNALLHYEWPGNVREISNIMERLCVLYPQQEVAAEELPAQIKDKIIRGISALTATIIATNTTTTNTSAEDGVTGDSNIGKGNLKAQMASLERELIAAALQQTSGNITQVAKELGVRKLALIDKMKKYGICDQKIGNEK